MGFTSETVRKIYTVPAKPGAQQYSIKWGFASSGFPVRRTEINEKKIPKDLFSLAFWMSDYYCTSLSKIFKYIFPSSIRKNIKPKFQIFVQLNKTKKEALRLSSEIRYKSVLQSDVLNLFLKKKKGFFMQDLLKLTNSSKSPIDSLIKKKILKSKKISYNEDLLLSKSRYFCLTLYCCERWRSGWYSRIFNGSHGHGSPLRIHLCIRNP